MAKYWLCLDGGGKWRDQKYVAFCGYMDTVDRLEAFSSRTWKPLLDRHKLSSLHFTKAMAWRDEWEKLRVEWGSDCDAMRAAVLGDFVDAIKQHPTMVPIGWVADSGHISRKAQDAKRPELMLFEKAITIATSKVPQGDRLSIFCDWEDGFDELCCRLLSKLRSRNVANARCIDLIAFGDDETYAELQAADMFAWLSCKELQRKADRPSDPVDPLYARLISDVVMPSHVGAPLGQLFDADTFARMLESQR